MAKTYYESCRGEFLHPWVNKADTKFNADGVFKVKLASEDKAERVEAQKAKIQAAAEAALAEHIADMPKGEAKKWSLYVPFHEEEDKDGEPTGRTVFDFKQNAKIELKDGSTKEVAIEIRDAKNQVADVRVFSGTIGRILYTMRKIVMSSTKQVGVRLDFFKVQVIKQAERKGGGAWFSSVDDEDAFVAGQESAGFGGGEDDEQGGEY